MKTIIKPPIFNPFLFSLCINIQKHLYNNENEKHHDHDLYHNLWGLVKIASQNNDFFPDWEKWISRWPINTKDSWNKLISKSFNPNIALEQFNNINPNYLIKNKYKFKKEEYFNKDKNNNYFIDSCDKNVIEEAIQQKNTGKTIWWVMSPTNLNENSNLAHKIGFSIYLSDKKMAEDEFFKQVIKNSQEVMKKDDWNQWIHPWSDWLYFAIADYFQIKNLPKNNLSKSIVKSREVWESLNNEYGCCGTFEEMLLAIFVFIRTNKNNIY
jgi:hypothetical protein